MNNEVWTEDRVKEAIARAADTERSLRGDGPRDMRAAWPDVTREPPADFKEKRAFEDARIMRRIVDDEAHRVVARDGVTYATHWAPGFDRPAPPTPQEVSEHDQVRSWWRFLGGRQDVIDAVWVCYGGGHGPSEAAKIIALHRGTKPASRDQIRMARDVGLALIVRGLNKERFPVLTPGFEAEEMDCTPANFHRLRNAAMSAIEALDPFVAALGHADPISTRNVMVQTRHLYKAGNAMMKLISALKK